MERDVISNLLQMDRLTEIVDIGANPIDGQPPYKPMIDAGVCSITGFEPQEQALEELLAKKGRYERYLPYAIGDGEPHILNICRASGMTSFFTPNKKSYEAFEMFKHLGEVVKKVSVETVKLNDIDDILMIDFLKIDIQGGELSVFTNGNKKLENAVAIQTEISFVPLYEDQPSFSDIDSELRQQGFIPHCFSAIKKWPIAPAVINNNPYQAINQLLEADIVYVRDFLSPELLTDEQIKHMALIVHHCYKSFDLTMRCIMLLEQRNVLPIGSQKSYIEIISGKVA